jgi:hypothetical protein
LGLTARVRSCSTRLRKRLGNPSCKAHVRTKRTWLARCPTSIRPPAGTDSVARMLPGNTCDEVGYPPSAGAGEIADDVPMPPFVYQRRIRDNGPPSRRRGVGVGEGWCCHPPACQVVWLRGPSLQPW